MDLIQILKDRVIPIVLNQDTSQHEPGILAEKRGIVASFLPILLSVLKSRPQLISSLQGSLNPRIGDLFPNNQFAIGNLLDAVKGNSVSREDTETLLNHSIAPTLGALEDLSGSNEPNAIVRFLEQHLDSIKAALPTWATSILAGLGVGGIANHAAAATPVRETVSHQTTTQYNNREEPEKKGGWLLPLIGLIILGLLAAMFLRYCNHKEQATPVAPPVESTAEKQPAFFKLSTDASGGLVNCQAKIGNPSFIETLQAKVKALFNHQTGCDVDSSEQYNAELTDQNGLADILQLVKGSPDTTLTWTGNEISLEGKDGAALQTLADKIKALAPNSNILVKTGAVDVDTAVNNSVNDAGKALSSLSGDQVKAEDIAKALNLQIINFATASNNIPDVNKTVLDQAATLMNRVPNVQLNVNGYTDSTGNADANQKLSQKRAQAVVDYLVSKGVDKSKLKATGFGQENPVADNTTDEGKFKNRRIEFDVTNTATGAEAHVNANGVEKTN